MPLDTLPRILANTPFMINRVATQARTRHPLRGQPSGVTDKDIVLGSLVGVLPAREWTN
ncbi:hypothetical protein APR09_006540 [Nocardia amikacinitolerans]|nr:hypothetical protein [Nocardia amikacinitolerans]